MFSTTDEGDSGSDCRVSTPPMAQFLPKRLTSLG